MYFTHAPWWLRQLYPQLTWQMPDSKKKLYLTFDDGPTPEITDWVLDQLEHYGFGATFFLIGNNVEKHPEIFRKLKESGHSLGNHTFHHLNGWKAKTEEYLKDFRQCEELLQTNLFRPPYGRIKRHQAKAIGNTHRIVMWSALSGDFDQKLDGAACFENLKKGIEPGAILVFHDSQKAWPRLKVALPKTLEYLKKEGYRSVAL